MLRVENPNITQPHVAVAIINPKGFDMFLKIFSLSVNLTL